MVAGISRLGTAKGFKIELVEKPFNLGELEKELLVKELNSVTKDAFGKDVPMQETRERTIETDRIYLVKKDLEVIGYMTNESMKLEGQMVNYFSSGFLKREFQGQGLYGIMNRFRLGDAADAIMTRTQNPLVIKGFHDLCRNNGFRFSPDGKVPERALHLAKAYDSRVEPELICRGVYGRELMDKTPEPSSATSRMFNSLDVQKGDAFILVGMKQ